MTTDVIDIDGSMGGGQVLRTALSLSMITGQPFRITRIRGQRSRPGLLRQHLTAVNVAKTVTHAHTVGAALNSTELEFRPGKISAGNYCVAIGTAGSTMLVLQTILPALMHADTMSRLRITGGTHNPSAPPFDFIERAWLPQIRAMGASVEVELVEYGFLPAGGGVIDVKVWPSGLQPIHLAGGADVRPVSASVLVSSVPTSVADRELNQIANKLEMAPGTLRITDLGDQRGPGNVVIIEGQRAGLTELFSSIGQPRVRAEQVANAAIEAYQEWAASDAAVSAHLADQLLLPMALARGGTFTTTRLSNHLHTNAAVIQQFLPVTVAFEERGNSLKVEVTPSR